MVRKIGTNRTQVHQRIQLRYFTPQQPVPDVQITSRESKPDPEMGVKHDDLYAGACDCDYETPVFDADYDNAAPPNLNENAWELFYLPKKYGTHQEPYESVSWYFPLNRRIMWRNGYVPQHKTWCDNELGTTKPYSYEPPQFKNDLLDNPKPNCYNDFRYWMPNTVWVMF